MRGFATAGAWWRRMLGAWIKLSWICNNQVEDQQGNWDLNPRKKLNLGRKTGKEGREQWRWAGMFLSTWIHSSACCNWHLFPREYFSTAEQIAVEEEVGCFFVGGRPAHTAESWFLVLLLSPLLKVGELCTANLSLLPALQVSVEFVGLLLFLL